MFMAFLRTQRIIIVAQYSSANITNKSEVAFISNSLDWKWKCFPMISIENHRVSPIFQTNAHILLTQQ